MSIARNVLFVGFLGLFACRFILWIWLARAGSETPSGDNLIRLSDHGNSFYVTSSQHWVLNGLMIAAFVTFVLLFFVDRRTRRSQK